jgi:ribonuclease D
MIAEVAEQHGVPVENVLTPDFLRTLCFEPPALNVQAVSESLRALGAREWQIELTAQLIVDGFEASLVADEASTDLA